MLSFNGKTLISSRKSLLKFSLTKIIAFWARKLVSSLLAKKCPFNSKSFSKIQLFKIFICCSFSFWKFSDNSLEEIFFIFTEGIFLNIRLAILQTFCKKFQQ